MKLGNSREKSKRLSRATLEARLPTYRLEKGHTLLLEGPGSIRLREGSAQCLGAPIPTGDWVVIGKPRQVPLFSPESSLLEIKLGSGGSWREVGESTIPAGWSEASQILRQSPGVTVIIGDVDSGKSSLCTFLANECFNQGMKVAVVDADVGQADIGPPTTISVSYVHKPILALQDLRPEVSFFIGDTSPSSVPAKLIHYLARLKEKATSSDAVLVNTDGWIKDGDATRYKLQLLDEADPNIVLGLSVAGEIDPLLDLVTSTSLKLERSSYAKTRTKEERKRAREAGYRRFLVDSRPLRLSLAEVKLRVFDQPEQAVLAAGKDLRGLLVGVLNQDESLLGIGRLRELRSGLALVETEAKGSPSFLEMGAVVLSSEYEEVGYGVLH